MKIIAAKVNSEPFHSLTIKDVKLILSLTPEAWYRNTKEVVLSATLFKNSKFDRPVFGHSGLYNINILSRGIPKKEIAKELLRELAILGREGQTQKFNHVPKKELKKIDEIIQPMLEAFLSART